MERLGSLDAVFLAIEHPSSPMNIGSLGIFDGPAPSLDVVRSAVATRLHAVPRCRQRVHRTWHGLARPLWLDDTSFDIERHVHGASVTDDPGALDRMVERVMMQPLDRRHALWEMWVVDGLADGRWATVSKVHHCMVDGIAGTDLLTALLTAAPRLDPEPLDTGGEPSGVDIAWFTLTAVLRSCVARVLHLTSALAHPTRTSRRLVDLVAGARALWLQPSRRGSTLTGPVGSTRTWVHTSTPLADVSHIGHTHGTTVNDVMLTALAVGFHDLLVARGEPVAGRDVMALVPVSTRAPDGRGIADNRVAVTHALLPLDIDDPVRSLAAVRTHMALVKSSHQTDASTALLHSGDVAPSAIAALVARGGARAAEPRDDRDERTRSSTPAPSRRPRAGGGLSVRTDCRMHPHCDRDLVVLRQVVHRCHGRQRRCTRCCRAPRRNGALLAGAARPLTQLLRAAE